MYNEIKVKKAHPDEPKLVLHDFSRKLWFMGLFLCILSNDWCADKSSRRTGAHWRWRWTWMLASGHWTKSATWSTCSARWPWGSSPGVTWGCYSPHPWVPPVRCCSSGPGTSSALTSTTGPSSAFTSGVSAPRAGGLCRSSMPATATSTNQVGAGGLWGEGSMSSGICLVLGL